jgi:hypothetical protein
MCYCVDVAPPHVGAALVMGSAIAHMRNYINEPTVAFETLRSAQGDRSGTPRGRLHKRTHRETSSRVPSPREGADLARIRMRTRRNKPTAITGMTRLNDETKPNFPQNCCTFVKGRGCASSPSLRLAVSAQCPEALRQCPETLRRTSHAALLKKNAKTNPLSDSLIKSIA